MRVLCIHYLRVPLFMHTNWVAGDGVLAAILPRGVKRPVRACMRDVYVAGGINGLHHQPWQPQRLYRFANN